VTTRRGVSRGERSSAVGRRTKGGTRKGGEQGSERNLEICKWETLGEGTGIGI